MCQLGHVNIYPPDEVLIFAQVGSSILAVLTYHPRPDVCKSTNGILYFPDESNHFALGLNEIGIKQSFVRCSEKGRDAGEQVEKKIKQSYLPLKLH